MTQRIWAARVPQGGWSRFRVVAVALAMALTLAAAATPAVAQIDDADRSGRVEVFALGQYSLSDEITFFGVDIEYEDTFGGGLGIGVNPSDFLNVNVTLLVGEATASVDLGAFGSIEDNATFISPEVNLDWNILDRDLTPFVTGGVGAMIFTGGEDDSTEFTYGGGAGVRWDFAEHAFLKVWYRAKWFEAEDFDERFLLHTFNVGIGWMR